MVACSIDFRNALDGRLQGLMQDRYSWWASWAELAKFLLPRRYRWLVTPNQMNRGSPLNGAIIDSTGTIAARVLASGMMSGITSPTRPWFRLRIEGYGPDDVSPVNLWLAECEKRMMRVFQESNFYNSIAVVYMDLGVFGTAPMLIHEDFDNVIHCTNPCAGEYYVGNDDRLQIRIFYREFVLTVSQCVQWFGLENCSETIKGAYRTKGASLTQEIAIRHCIEPNDGAAGIPKSFKFREVYWERGSTNETVLQKRGYYEWPMICPRWDLTGNDAYGRSPGMDALGDVKQLQQEQRRKAQALDKLANPPMVADVELKNQPASTLPGGVTYVAKPQGAGFKPAYENFRPPIQEIMEDIKQVQERIRIVFFNDLFLMISQLQTVRTATEIDARREEKLVMLGPVLERFQNEALDPVIDRTFGIMKRGGLLGPAPPEISGKFIQVEYVSMLAAAQAAVSTSGIERWFGMIGNMAAVHPDILDIPNWDVATTEYGTLLGVMPKLMKTKEEVLEIRQAKAAQQKRADDIALAAQGVDSAQTLSQTDTQGNNALTQLMGAGQ